MTIVEAVTEREREREKEGEDDTGGRSYEHTGEASAFEILRLRGL